MTISTTTRTVTHNGNGVAVNFTYPFKIDDAADLLVYLKSGSVFVLKTLGTDYSLTGVRNPGGGTVTFFVAPASATGNVRFLRRTALTQLVDYITNDDFPAEIHEAALDKLTMAVQDYLGDSLTLDATADYWDAKSKVIKNVADPVDPQDAVNKQYIEEHYTATAVTEFVQSGSGAVARTASSKMREILSVADFGAIGDGVTDDTAAIQAAIASIRTNPVQILDTIGGSLITVYTSGTVYFPKGVYLISPDALQISQDIGLKFAGDGSRRTNNAEYGASTLLVSAASTGFAVKAYRSGGRGLTIEDMDVCYNGSFTGSLIDVDDAPGLTMNRCYVGTYGITGSTRQTTAAACIRSTYDEFMTFDGCVFNGAQLGWWIDNARTFAGNTFGGSVTKFDNCVFYDFAVNQVYSDGARTKIGMNFVNCAFNPISVAPSSSSVNVDNVDGFNLTGCIFNVSVGFPPASQWLRATNCTGNITGNVFGDLAPAAVLSGQLDVSCNQFAGMAGPTLTGGVIIGSSNEFLKGSGWLLSSPIDALSIDIGPDLFKSAVTYSYDIPVDNPLFSGRVNYAKETDNSTNKFRNTSERIAIIGTSGRLISTSSTSVALSILETGHTYLATGGSAQAFTLPVPIPGTRLCVSKVSSVGLSVTCSGGTNFYGVGSIYPTAASLTGAAMGTLELEAYAAIGWLVTSLTGSWSFT